MSYTNGLDNPELYFQTKLYTGNAGTLAVTLDGDTDMQPDLVWGKGRAVATPNALFDSVRGATKYLEADRNVAEATVANSLTSFDSDGFTLGADTSTVINYSQLMVAWCWKAGGSASSNTDGSITSSVSANTTAGFSIVKYTGAGVGTTTTIGHGLGGVPEMYIVKSLDSVGNWQTYHHKMSSAPETDYIQLDTTEAVADYTFWGDTAPTSTVFTVKDGNDVNESGEEFIAYCFRSIKGYSKFGSYTGGSDPFVYLGFKPAFVMFKNASATENWRIVDNKRDVDNPVVQHLYPNLSAAEGSGASYNDFVDFLSNGFKIRSGSGEIDGSGNTIIYMAFSEAPFVSSSGVPNNAR